jgi:hypothetical protein
LSSFRLELVLLLLLLQSLTLASKLADDRGQGFRVRSLFAQPDAESQSFGVKAWDRHYDVKNIFNGKFGVFYSKYW